MSTLLMARQPIFTADLDVVAYELLYRPTEHLVKGDLDGEQATSSVLTHAFLDCDTDAILGSHKAFVNFTGPLLLSGAAHMLSPTRLVVEVLEDTLVDDDIVEAVRQLVVDGYTVALDDFVYSEEWEPLIELADIVKLDVLALGMEGTRRQVQLLKRFNVKLLAEKVETQAEFDTCRSLGFRYFQGYFLARPRPVVGNRLEVHRLNALALLEKVYNPAVSFDEIDAVVRLDAALSFRLLRLIHSAHAGLRHRVTSTRHALGLLGLLRIRTWITLSTLSAVEDGPRLLINVAMCRARFCEGLATFAGCSDPDAYFVAGLFSNLDVLLGQPMEDLVGRLPLAVDIERALLHGDGPVGEALNCAIAHESADWDQVVFGDLSPGRIQECWMRAVRWADEVSSSL